MAKKTFKAKFQRVEIKYLITKTKLKELLVDLKEYLEEDDFPTSTIGNIYYDTDDYRMIRESLEKPLYKEKLRLRTYHQINSDDSEVFIEIKKKFQKVVYKRRISASLLDSYKYLSSISNDIEESQIKQEIDYLKERYQNLLPKMYIYYDRYSMKDKLKEGVRITVDHNILYREYDLELNKGIYGNNLIDKDMVIMEIKVEQAFPIWLSEILAKHKIFKSSFSKYGTAYRKIRENGGINYERTLV